MVAVSAKSRATSVVATPFRIGGAVILLALLWILFTSFHPPSLNQQLRDKRVDLHNHPISFQLKNNFPDEHWKKYDTKKKGAAEPICPILNLAQLTQEELQPRAAASHRYIVDPPRGGKVSLVCCTTTKGPLNILVHHKWAPLGAQHFVDMVAAGYFAVGVPMMRCIPGFLCQFGLPSTPTADFRASIPDDPNWLPEGKTNRTNSQGVKRFARGFLAYAGAGPNSRSRQFIVALKDNGPLGGGSPWEVPWGEVFGEQSFATLEQIYTGYGEKGPPQGRLGSEGMTVEMKAEWPLLDYIENCVMLEAKELEDSDDDDED